MKKFITLSNVPGKNRRNVTVVFFLVVLLLITAVFSTTIGAVHISVADIFRKENLDIVSLRLARILLGIVAGAALSVSGVVLQAILRNPLADPYVLGVSSGASVGAAATIILGGTGAVLGISILPLGAFLGAILAMTLVYHLARFDGRLPVQTLLLSGVIVGAILSSILLFLIATARERMLHSAIWWLLGNLQIFAGRLLFTVGLMVTLGVVLIYLFAGELNLIVLGEETAQHLGLNVEVMKKVFFLLASLITGACVSACGLIGFVGLIVPHACRLVVGPDHRILIPVSALSGAIFLVVCDIFARVVLAPAELPIGVITALAGGPFFIYLLRKKRKIGFR